MDSSLTDLGLEDEDPAPTYMVDAVSPKLVGTDHPLFNMDIEGLTNSDAAWMQQRFLAFYSENTRLSMEAKFPRFHQSFPAYLSCIYRYVHFLYDEGQISVHSLGNV